jgi:hypothetical protein
MSTHAATAPQSLPSRSSGATKALVVGVIGIGKLWVRWKISSKKRSD